MSDDTDIATMLAARKPDEPVYALRPHAIRAAAELFTTSFPGEVLYAVKANPDPLVLEALYAGGIRQFDVASLEEIRLVKERFPAVQCFFMHPVKAVTALREAANTYGITHFAVDHPDELAKIIVHTAPKKPTVVVRLAMPHALAVYDLGGKFGCTVTEAVTLCRAALTEGLGVGLSFHVGSQCLEPQAYRLALTIAGEVLRRGAFEPELIDIGGGFPVAYQGVTVPPLQIYLDAVRDGLTTLATQRPVRLLCEPGRALVAEGGSLIVKVELRRGDALYLNDGLFGGIDELRYASLHFPLRVWRVNGIAQLVRGNLENFRFLGPTCDSSDRLDGPFALPADIRMGDYIEIGQMGAYSQSLRSDFNGFRGSQQVVVKDPPFRG